MEEEILKRIGFKYDELTGDERATLFSWVDSVNRSTLTLEDVKENIRRMRDAVEQELTQKRNSPEKWVTLLTFFIPILGIIQKWYQDQREVELKARLRCYTLIEALLTSPERAREQLERAIAGIAGKGAK